MTDTMHDTAVAAIGCDTYAIYEMELISEALQSVSKRMARVMPNLPEKERHRMARALCRWPEIALTGHFIRQLGYELQAKYDAALTQEMEGRI